jgi:hypothetical protein
MEIVTFVIEGRAEVGPSETKDPDWLACVELNKKADEMASTMEREIRRLMLPGGGITVQADLWFRPGASVILEGSVILLCWAGRTALEPIREELANAIKTVTRRVLNRAVSALSNLPNLANLRLDAPSIDVASLPPMRADTPLASTPTPPLTPASTQQAALPGTILQNQRWLIVVVGILGVLVLILLADRIISASLPRNVYVWPATSALPGVTSTPTAPTPAPAPK